MSTVLLELNDKIITDRGDVVLKFSAFLDRTIQEISTGENLVESDPELIGHVEPARIWNDTKQVEGPEPEQYEWDIPHVYKDIDLNQYAMELLNLLDIPPNKYGTYRVRLENELEKIRERNMDMFVKTLIYLTDVMQTHQLVWGIGRGSSCASLLLFVLGINRVDPIRYDIKMEEFFK